MITLTKQDLIRLGFGPTQSQNIIRMSKYHMVQQGYSYYNSKRLGRVPVHAVEEILGISLDYTPLNEVSANG
ncbi:DUF3173 domain-containing protein [Carnobacterium divergens]|uniref:DUF3173 domain-containing protein n=1 Tax=Carnobacterium divergens TaxID=2748 RepID=A0A7Z8CZ45_CARDV|nr:DUF3173 domain-containing protein [Carnobacterium divergens]TFI73632.1 DUF3173 domain-containing protein [Carnobacterium divergens]TFI77579.1 DUF3173 domain-containing protein [Carnobacterium divergens]TFI84342.1 DUF3173 domain-containing protein [Carnobacterium divergens]TFI96189.1 DUF3173 domain-containing protein [Carnobacterium divergens]TFJ12492.1 DUF3173 domain-containing protein [Carnobacterium divergens]